MGRRIDKARAWLTRLRGTDSPRVPLLPLTPEYEPDRHSVYFNALQDALKRSNSSILNVALTGSYGVGKSSILSQVTRNYKSKAIAISLSTLGFLNEPAGVAERDDPTWKTNRIQKEIVKQLLYSQDPVKMPGSRYRRMTRLRIWREIPLACVLAVPIMLLSYLVGWTESFALLVVLPENLALLIHALVFVGAATLVLGFRTLFHNRVQIEQITAGSATISLSTASSSYFDEYLDEIVYFFEMTKRDIVIFEDIDRFDEPHIFETLRALNGILNGAKQLKRRRIRFIYAIKDSIFDELGSRAAREELESLNPQPAPMRLDSAEAELARANRTKFFDLVIPVVPFVTHRSARDMIVETMNGIDHQVSDELIGLAARHVADMRLIKNLRNEFLIFKQLIIDAGGLELRQDNLYAMMLYKSTHLSDFEQIKLGKSNLDSLYRDARELVTSSVKILNNELRTARAARAGAKISAIRSEKLGTALVNYIKLAVFDNQGTSIEGYALNQNAITPESLHSVEFWTELAKSDGILTVAYRLPNYSSSRSLRLDRATISEALGEPIRDSDWVADERARIDTTIRQLSERREFVERASMSELMKRSDFTLERSGNNLTFSQVVRSNLRSELAVQLVAAGYIDKNFTLYTSTFPENWTSANATNFVLKNIDTNIPDLFFVLSADDVDAIIREKGESVLIERSARNISILDRLLDSAPDKARILMNQLLAYGEDEREFFHAYLDNGQDVEKFIVCLTQFWSELFVALIDDVSVDEARLRELVDCVLMSLGDDVSYNVGESFRQYLLSNYADLAAFGSDELSEVSGARILRLLKEADIKLPDLRPLSPMLLGQAIENGCYLISRDNLYVALGSRAHPLSLDRICSSSEMIYQHVLSELPSYLAFLPDDQVTVAEPERFVPIIHDVCRASGQCAGHIVERADVRCRVESLEDVPAAVWPALAKGYRFWVTLRNVQMYIDECGFGDALGEALTHAGRIVHGSDDRGSEDQENDKLRVALSVLSARNEIPSARTRARLVEGLSLAHWISAGEIGTESGELVGHLIAMKVIEDNADAFGALERNDTSGLIFAISKSTNFVDFMSPSLLPPSVLPSVLEEDIVPDVVKDTIVDRFAEFTVGASRGVLATVAEHVLRRGRKLDFSEVARLAIEGVVPSLVLPLLRPHLSSLTIAELAPVLLALDGPYRHLAERNGKRPRIPNTPADHELAAHLCSLGVATRAEPDGLELRVNMRRK